jgi:flagellar motor switch protein FliN/FliY
MSDGNKLDQNDIERLLAEAQGAAGAVSAPPAAAPASVPPPAADSATGAIDQGSIDALLAQAQSALSSIDEKPAPLPAGVKPFEFKSLGGSQAANEAATIDLLRDVQLDLRIELGRTHMHLEDVLRLKQGAVVTLDKLAGDPVDIYANGRLIARGEVLVLNDSFCVRVAELVAEEAAA